MDDVTTIGPRLRRRLRSRFVEGPGSLGERSRIRRWKLLVKTFPEIGSMRVIDLGGTVGTWRRAPVQPAEVVVVNLRHRPAEDLPGVVTVEGDACRLPTAVRETQFDLVFSNSLIEHVGGHHRRDRLAENVHALAPRHWVQTPYRYFPIEPHWLFPGFQFFPVRARAAIARNWPLVHTPPADRTASLRSVMSTELLSVTEMGIYFPDSEIVRERIGPMTKSLIAVKRGSA